ncbi:hypothetical protein KC460_02475 [Candidatus Dependentiae bacterium]|nr:hypothetical protein [Candidatus Dependentiae bacterium]
MKPKIIFYLLLYLFFFITDTLAIVVGSDTVPSRQSAVTFLSSDTDNEMRGFAAFENGFVFQNSYTECLFNSFFPVGGSVKLNGGILNLNRDLLFESNAVLENGGTIFGNGNIIFLPDKITVFSFGGAMVFNNVDIVLNSHLNLNGEIRFEGECQIEGNGYQMNVSSGALAVGEGSIVTIKNTTISGVAQERLYCTHNSGVFCFENVLLIQDANYSFTQGSIEVIGGKLKMSGSHVFTYESDQTSTVRSGATWLFDINMSFSYASSSSQFIALEDEKALLYLRETNLYVTSIGLQLTKGSLVVEGECSIFSDATEASGGIIFGDGVLSNNNLFVNILDESGLKIESGFVSNKNV